MSINVTVDMSGVPAKIEKISKNQQLGQAMADAGLKVMNTKYVPFLEGGIFRSGQAAPFKVTWNTPYAKRHFNGYGDANRTRDTHPLATSHWDQPKDVKQQIAQAAQRWLKGQ